MGSRLSSPTTRVLIALAAGLAIGVAISASGSSALESIAAAAEPIGIVWINAIRMTVIPLVVSLLFVSMAGFVDVRSAGRLGGRTLLTFAAFLIGAAVFAALTVPPVFAWMPVDATTTGTLNEVTLESSVQQQAKQLPSFAQWLTDLVPTNPVRAAADGAMLPLVLFSVLFGLSSTVIAAELRETLLRFFRAVSEAMLTIVGWLIALAPIGVFALVLPLAARTGAATVGAFAYYVVAMCGLLVVLTLAVYPVAAVLGRVSVRQFALAALPGQAIAFSSQSSLAALPGLLEGADKQLPGSSQTTGFVLPLAVAIFKFVTPLVWLSGAYFVARLYGVQLGPAEIGLILMASVALSFTAPGIPMGSLVILAPVFASVGLPVEGIGILMAIDLIPDTFKTISNVTGDMAAAVVLSRGSTAPEHARASPHDQAT
jgi:proton glutamate symport protein